MEINANYNTLPVGQPKPNVALKKLPVVVREKVDASRLPVQYDEAVKALAACTTIDESKHWADKAEALAAWAKVYKDDQVAIEARRLKLHAYRRMGELAQELEKQRVEHTTREARDKLARETEAEIGRLRSIGLKATGANAGNRELLRLTRRLHKIKAGSVHGAGHVHPAPVKRLQAVGLSETQAMKAMQLTRVLPEEFKQAVDRAEALGVAAKRGAIHARSSEAWRWLSTEGPRLSSVRSVLRHRTPRDVAFLIAPGEVKAARELAIDLIDWLDAFEQALPKTDE